MVTLSDLRLRLPGPSSHVYWCPIAPRGELVGPSQRVAPDPGQRPRRCCRCGASRRPAVPRAGTPSASPAGRARRGRSGGGCRRAGDARHTGDFGRSARNFDLSPGAEAAHGGTSSGASPRAATAQFDSRGVHAVGKGGTPGRRPRRVGTRHPPVALPSGTSIAEVRYALYACTAGPVSSVGRASPW